MVHHTEVYKTPEPDFDFEKPVFKTFDGLSSFADLDEKSLLVKFCWIGLLP